MMVDAVSVAVVGATSLVGEELVRVLAERQFPVGALRLLGSSRTAGRRIEERVVGLVGPDAFDDVDLAFFAAGPRVAGLHAEDALRAGAVVVDVSSRFRLDESVPLVVPEVNGHLLTAEGAPSLVASPSSTAVGLGIVLAPLAEAVGIRRAVVTTFQSAAGAGRRTIEALSKESIALLSGRGQTEDVALRQAFNCIPRVGTLEADGVTSHERAVAAELQKLLEQPDLSLQLTAVRVPMFFGTAASVALELEQPLDRDAASAVLRGARGVLLHEDDEPDDVLTPARVVGSEATHVGRVREDPSVRGGLALWMAIDSIEKGAALNAVQIAEILVRRAS